MQCERTTVSSAPPPKCRSFSRYTTGSGCPTLAGECASSGSSTTVSWACQLSVESIGSVTSSGDVPWLTRRGIPDAKVRVVPSPLPDDAYVPGDASWGRDRVGGPFILYLGRLHEEKGVDDLLEAFSRLPPDARLVLAGPDGGRLSALRTRARDL